MEFVYVKESRQRLQRKYFPFPKGGKIEAESVLGRPKEWLVCLKKKRLPLQDSLKNF